MIKDLANLISDETFLDVHIFSDWHMRVSEGKKCVDVYRNGKGRITLMKKHSKRKFYCYQIPELYSILSDKFKFKGYL